MSDIAALLSLGVGLIAALATLAAYARTRVVPVTAPRAARREAVAMLAARTERAFAGETVYDLGCGTGALLVDLARAFPEARVIGVELSPVPWLIAKLRTMRRANVEVRFGDFFRTPLAGAGAVACYLMLGPMARLAAKLDGDLAQGTPVVALAFLFRGRAPEASARVPALFPMEVAVYRWQPQIRSDSMRPQSP